MKYVYCIVIPLLLQLITVYIIVEMNTGNGSWIGLMVFLLAIPVVPITAVVNGLRTRRYYASSTIKLFFQSLIVAAVVPAVIILFFVASAVIEGLLLR